MTTANSAVDAVGAADARRREGRPPPDAVISVSDLVKKFGSKVAVDHLSFSVRRGEVFGLLGPNGSGKTTTINIISGLSAATSGSVRVLDHDPRRQAGAVRRRLGVVPQETALYEELSARRNLVFHAQLYGIPRRERHGRVATMLELAQLTSVAGQRVGTFSGGMQRRLAIARALLHQPDLVYLDEPTLGVDVQARFVIWDYIRAMRAEGRTVLLTTNYLEESDQLCDRIAVIDHGRLVALDTPARLKNQYGSGLVDLELATEPGRALTDGLAALPGVQATTVEGRSLRLVLAAPGSVSEPGSGSASGSASGSDGADASGPGYHHAVLPRVLAAITRAGADVVGINLREPSLDEVFLALTGKGVRD